MPPRRRVAEWLEDLGVREAPERVRLAGEALDVADAPGAVDVPEEGQDLRPEAAPRRPVGRAVLEVGHAALPRDGVDVVLGEIEERPRDRDAVERVAVAHTAQVEDAAALEDVRDAVLADVADVVAEEHRLPLREFPIKIEALFARGGLVGLAVAGAPAQVRGHDEHRQVDLDLGAPGPQEVRLGAALGPIPVVDVARRHRKAPVVADDDAVPQHRQDPAQDHAVDAPGERHDAEGHRAAAAVEARRRVGRIQDARAVAAPRALVEDEARHRRAQGALP